MELSHKCTMTTYIVSEQKLAAMYFIGLVKNRTW